VAITEKTKQPTTCFEKWNAHWTEHFIVWNARTNKRGKLCCVIMCPPNYSKQIGAGLCVQVVAQHVPYLPTLVSKHLHTSNPYIHLHSGERGK
jgi:hypothetical protein